MIFCKVCGGALNLFETHNEEVCYSCLKKGIKQEKPPPLREKEDEDPLANASLEHEEGKFVLRSAEGWVLWSAPDTEVYRLDAILARARRICEIRNKRRK
jgi:hypothetical protein